MALRDMTRPRMVASARSWRVALLVATNAMLAAPIGTRRISAASWVGESATARMAHPNTTPMTARSRVDGRLRKAVASPPITAPAPIAARNRL